MPLLDWKDEFQTGIGYIDYEHRRLVELINQACESLDAPGAEARVAECLGDLYSRICAHFALEEQLMRERRYRLYDEHKASHEALLEEMRYMMDAFEAGACETCGQSLSECLAAWFHKHFETLDARFETLRR